MTMWICKLSMTGGQVRVTIPKGLVEIKPFLKTGYVQLDDRLKAQIIIKGVEIDAEKTTNGKTGINRKDIAT